MQMATGTITTVASQLQGGVLADEQHVFSDIRDPQRTIPPPIHKPDQPLSETWDLWVVMVLICIIYVLYHRYSLKKQ